RAAAYGVSSATLLPGTVVSVVLFPERSSLPAGSGIEGADLNGGALVTGLGGGQDLGGNAVGNLAICPVDAAGTPLLPPPGRYCHDFDDAARPGWRTDVPEGLIEWAAWATGPVAFVPAPAGASAAPPYSLPRP